VVIQTGVAASNVSPKKKSIALLLCIIFGMIGIHRFYLGKILTGILMIIFSITVYLAWITAIWVFIDAIRLIFTSQKDSNGREMEW
jgi:TM2 domain-containing membrane protein YozV